jgi:hypothetical protein
MCGRLLNIAHRWRRSNLGRWSSRTPANKRLARTLVLARYGKEMWACGQGWPRMLAKDKGLARKLRMSAP